MIELDDKTLRRMQLIQLEMLTEVDRVSKKCGIRYNIMAGTLLGAVRHGGYIPWDDDADIGLLRPEYEKFRIACETELDHTKFVFQDHRNTPGYRWGYGKLRRKDTVFLREYQEHMPYMQGVFIDIFPMDNVPDNYLLRSIHNFQCFCIRKVLWSEVGRLAHKNPVMRKWYGLLRKVPLETVFDVYRRFMEKGNRKETKMVRVLTYPTPNRVWGYYRRWYEDSAEIEFEGKIFQGIRDWDEYLSFTYGDYMTLPPAEKRKVHPVTDIQLIAREDTQP